MALAFMLFHKVKYFSSRLDPILLSVSLIEERLTSFRKHVKECHKSNLVLPIDDRFNRPLLPAALRLNLD